MYILKIKILIPFILLFIAFTIQTRSMLPTLVIDKQDSALNIDIDFLKFSVAPYKMITTDLYWIATLMESDLDHYKNDDLNSWMFLRFKTITELDPNFLKAYQFGGQYLNIIKDDLEGSSYIFERGLKIFPEDYILISAAAFLYAFEIKNTQKAISLYQKAITFPQAPDYYKSILTKLNYNTNQDAQEAFFYLREVYKNTPEGIFRMKLKDDLYSLKAMIDLECLNSKKKNCDEKDFDNNRYIKINGIFVSQKKFEPYKLYIRNKEE